MQPNHKFIALRKRLGPSQSEFATKTGISRSTIADIERGRIGVSKKVKEKIVEKFPEESGFFDNEFRQNDSELTQGTELGLSQGKLVSLEKNKQKKGLPYSFYEGFSDGELNFELSFEKQRFKDMYEDAKKLTEVLHKLKPTDWLREKFPLLPPFSDYLKTSEDEFLELHSHLKDERQIKIVKLVELYQESWEHWWRAVSRLIEYMHQYADSSLMKGK